MNHNTMQASGTIPFLDINSMHRELENELVEVFRNTLRTGKFVGGEKVEDFEKEFARFCHTGHCVGVGSGTDALHFALLATGILPGDRVITVPNTFIATTEAVLLCGAYPVFVDVNEKTFNLDVNRMRDYLETQCIQDDHTGKTVETGSGKPVTAVIPVHLYGQMADMDPILELAAKYRLTVIEDACQAHGAEYFSKKTNRWHKAGSMGRAGAFSFYPGKNLGALGEAGAVTTSDEGVARYIRMLRDHGQSRKYIHDIEGTNGRLDALQAEFLGVKLTHLNRWNDLRLKAAERYHLLLAAMPEIVIPFSPAWANPVYHLYIIRAKNRDRLKQHLLDNGIETGLHYPIPLHLQKAYQKRGQAAGQFPVTEKAAKEILSLPMFPSLTESQQQQIFETLAEFYLQPVLV